MHQWVRGACRASSRKPEDLIRRDDLWRRDLRGERPYLRAHAQGAGFLLRLEPRGPARVRLCLRTADRLRRWRRGRDAGGDPPGSDLPPVIEARTTAPRTARGLRQRAEQTPPSLCYRYISSKYRCAWTTACRITSSAFAVSRLARCFINLSVSRPRAAFSHASQLSTLRITRSTPCVVSS